MTIAPIVPGPAPATGILGTGLVLGALAKDDEVGVGVNCGLVVDVAVGVPELIGVEEGACVEVGVSEFAGVPVGV